MSKVTVEHVPQGWIGIFKSPEMAAVVDQAGERIAREAGEPWFRYYPKPGKFTAMGFVSSTGPTGAAYEATRKSLTKAVHA